MREIDRSRYLRGTKAWPVRNWFIFGGLTLTLLIGTTSVLMLPGVRDTAIKKMEEEKAAKLAKREKIEAIQRHREQLETERMPEKKE